MADMFKRELLRIVLIAACGFVIGLLGAFHFNRPILILIGPLYVLGTVYGIRQILSLLGGVSKAGFFSMAFRPTGCMFSIIFTIIGFIFVLTFGWIIGLVVMGKVLYWAHSTDSAIRQVAREDTEFTSTPGRDPTSSSSLSIHREEKDKSWDDQWGDY